MRFFGRKPQPDKLFSPQIGPLFDCPMCGLPAEVAGEIWQTAPNVEHWLVIQCSGDLHNPYLGVPGPKPDFIA